MVIQEKYFKKLSRNGDRSIYLSLVRCESPYHKGDLNRLISLDRVKKGKGASYCKECEHFHIKRKGMSEENKLKLSLSRRGKGNPMYGRTRTAKQKEALQTWLSVRIFTPEYRKHLSESLKGEKNIRWNPNRDEVKKRIKLQNACRSQLRRLLKLRPKHWRPEEELGYSYLEFAQHLESTWDLWMNWDNYGKSKNGTRTWEIDHVKPVKRYHSEGIYEASIINALSNLRALESTANNRKNACYAPIITDA